MNKASTPLALAALGALPFALAACAAAEPAATDVSDPSEAPAIGSVDLSGVCPATVVIQTDWNPQSEQGGLFQLLGPDAEIDSERKVTHGQLFAAGEYTGVDIEIRAGGPAIGFQGVPAQMYSDPEILLGWVNTDEAIATSAEMPTTAVLATFEKAPWMIMWDPETYPDVSTIEELAATGATIRYFDGATWMEYLVGAGIVSQDQIDGSYDGSPGNFLAAGGADAQQGFATVEPYVYEFELEEWGKPINYELIADTGYPLYAVALSARTEDVVEQADCLEALVPVIQQSTVDFFAEPAAANELIVAAVEQYDTGWVYPAGEAENSTAQQIALGLVSNGDDAVFGDFDEARVAEVMDIVLPILDDSGIEPGDGVSPAALATNEFLDPSIGLPAAS